MNFRSASRLSAALVMLPAACALSAATYGEETLTAAQVLQRVAAAESQAGAVDFDMALESGGANGPAMRLTGRGAIHADGKRYRLELRGGSGKAALSLRFAFDGETLWGEAESPPGNVTVHRWSSGACRAVGGPLGAAPLPRAEWLQTAFDWRVAREEKLDGVSLAVLEGTVARDAAERQMEAARAFAGPQAAALARSQIAANAGVRLYVDLVAARVRRMVVLNGDGSVAWTLDVLNLRSASAPANAQFAYTPPPGARVIDLDEMGKRRQTPTSPPKPDR